MYLATYVIVTVDMTWRTDTSNTDVCSTHQISRQTKNDKIGLPVSHSRKVNSLKCMAITFDLHRVRYQHEQITNVQHTHALSSSSSKYLSHELAQLLVLCACLGWQANNVFCAHAVAIWSTSWIYFVNWIISFQNKIQHIYGSHSCHMLTASVLGHFVFVFYRQSAIKQRC